MVAMLDGFRFLTQGVREVATVGAVWPSGKPLCRAMVESAFENAKGPLRILEVGAGVGPVTAELVDRLLPGDVLDVVELNPRFCEILTRRFEGGSLRPRVHNADILTYAPEAPYHHIVSGLPLANFPAQMVEAIYRKFFELLEPGGTLSMFQHILMREVIRTFATPKHRRRARQLMEIEEQLSPLVVDERTVMLNVPPARVVVRRRPIEVPEIGAVPTLSA
jgi:phosphatidylethanolamine/phosphatidyl-N-methylethanolamine N-methyltransferase